MDHSDRGGVNGSRGTRWTAGVVFVALSATLLSSYPARAEGRKTQARRLSAESTGPEVILKGWATFSGAILATTDDPKDDGQTAAETHGAEMIEATIVYRPELEDFFVRMEFTKIPSANVGIGGVGVVGDPTTLYGFKFTAGGIAYEIRAQSLGDVNPDAPGAASFGLFKCNETTCTKVASLKGGYGTAGEKIVTALPLKVLRDDGTNIQEGDKLGDLYAYAAAGTFLGGPTAVLYDDARPTKEAEVVVPVKSVTVSVKKFSKEASLKDGYFEVSLPAKYFKTATTTVTTKTCLGVECVTQTFKVANGT